MTIESWKSEKRSAHLYRALAEVERGTRREKLFSALAAEAEGQAELWARKLGSEPGEYRPDIRAAAVEWLVRRVGPARMTGVLAAMKVRGMSVYRGHSHGGGHEMPESLQDVGLSHGGLAGAGAAGNLRAAVFGVSDGLVSNTSLIFGVAGGVAGAQGDSRLVLLSGTAGLLAGAFSMAAGEYLSMRSQREMFEYQIALEREELAEYPREEAAELALIYEAKGVSRDEARRIADAVVADPAKALDTLAREELGLNPEDLGSPWGAALSSFAAFGLGAAVPLVPVALGCGDAATGGVAAAGLFAVGAALSLFTGRSAALGGLRMLGLGGLAAGATYVIGASLGVSLN